MYGRNTVIGLLCERLVHAALLVYPLLVVSTLLAVFTYCPASLAGGILDPEIVAAVELSLISALLAITLAVILGTPLAYYLSRHTFRGKRLVESLIDIPVSIPPLVCGVGLLLLFGANGLMGRNLTAWGINVIFTLKGAVLAQFFIAAPLYIQTVKTTFETIDRRFETVARTLGSSPARAFFRVTLPLSREGIINGMSISFARCMAEFGATLMVASAIAFKTETLPLAVYMNMSTGNFDLAISAASILIVISLCTIVSIRAVTGRIFKTEGT